MGRRSLDEKIKQRLFEQSFLSISDISPDYGVDGYDVDAKICEDLIIQSIEKPTRKKIVKMRCAGISYTDIAEIMGITRQRVHQVYNETITKIKDGTTEEERRDFINLFNDSISPWSSFEVSESELNAARDRHNKDAVRIQNKIYFEKNRYKELAFYWFWRNGLKRQEISDDLLSVKVEHLKLRRAIKKHRRHTNG
jgi:transcriptional regulator